MKFAATLCAKASKNSSKSGSYRDNNLLFIGEGQDEILMRNTKAPGLASGEEAIKNLDSNLSNIKTKHGRYGAVARIHKGEK